MTPLKQSDPITPEALKRMGGRCHDLQDWEYKFPSNDPGPEFFLSIYPAMGCDGCTVWNRSGREVHIRMPENLGELSDLCRCLGIQLSEVPE